MVVLKEVPHPAKDDQGLHLEPVEFAELDPRTGIELSVQNRSEGYADRAFHQRSSVQEKLKIVSMDLSRASDPDAEINGIGESALWNRDREAIPGASRNTRELVLTVAQCVPHTVGHRDERPDG